MNNEIKMPSFTRAFNAVLSRELSDDIIGDVGDELYINNPYEIDESYLNENKQETFNDVANIAMHWGELHTSKHDDGDNGTTEDESNNENDGVEEEEEEEEEDLLEDERILNISRIMGNTSGDIVFIQKIVDNISSLGFSKSHVLKALVELNPDVRTCGQIAFLHAILDKLVSEASFSRGDRSPVPPHLSEFKLVSQDFTWPVQEMAEYEFGIGSLNKVNFDNVLVITNIPLVSDVNIAALYEIFMSLIFSQIGPVRDVYIPKEVSQDGFILKGHGFVEFESSTSSLIACRCIDEFSFGSFTLKARMFRHYRQISENSSVGGGVGEREDYICHGTFNADSTEKKQSRTLNSREKERKRNMERSHSFESDREEYFYSLDDHKPMLMPKVEGPLELLRKLNQEKQLVHILNEKIKKLDDERCLVLGENRLLVSKTVALEDTLDELEITLRRNEHQKIELESHIHSLERDLHRERESNSKEMEVLRKEMDYKSESKASGDCDLVHIINNSCLHIENNSSGLQKLNSDEILLLEMRVEAACKLLRNYKDIARERELKSKQSNADDRIVVCQAMEREKLDKNLIIAYTGWGLCDEEMILKSLVNGVNVIMWSFGSLDSDQFGKPVVNLIPLESCVLTVINNLDKKGYNKVIHMLSFGGWNSNHAFTNKEIFSLFNGKSYYEAFKKWNESIRRDSGLPLFDGIDWDYEGNDDPKNSNNFFTFEVLEIMYYFSLNAKNDGYYVSLAPPETYLYSSFEPSIFNRSLLFASNEWEKIFATYIPNYVYPFFAYHGRNAWSYLLYHHCHTHDHSLFDFISIQFYESYTHFAYDVQLNKMSISSALISALQNYYSGWKVDFTHDDNERISSLGVKDFHLNPEQLVIGTIAMNPVTDLFSTTPPYKKTFTYGDPPNDLKDLIESGVKFRGLMYWSINDDQQQDYYLSKGLGLIYKNQKEKEVSPLLEY